mmetsp:Transcript_47985/g.71098  ORF Transcript_47985/g.71098 Transcript_47985/m.71098 type:complete len:285 (-) Transcript_47985:128-982(-)
MPAKKEKPSGVYSRPSAAIEKGSGFYVPGLEGSRVRSLFGAIVIILCKVNSLFSDADTVLSSQMFSELLAYGFGALLLFQGVVEFGKESGFVVNLDDGNTSETLMNIESAITEDEPGVASGKALNQVASASLSKTAIEALQWIAASFISLTPATHVLLVEADGLKGDDGKTLENGSILFRLGDFDSGSNDIDNDEASIISAVRTAHFESKGGRVSVPSTHPAGQLLPEEYRRCVLLQRLVSSKDEKETNLRCLIIGSNQLLPAFTKGDLKWLGSLSRYAEFKTS